MANNKVFEEPIKISVNPLWKIAKRFGRDESIAMIINIIGSVLIAFFTTSALLISLAGPVIEKIGFFPAHFKESFGVYKTTPENKRKKLSFYYKKALKNGSLSLIEDILVHDPFYILFMYFGLKIYSGTPVWMLSFTSFIIAVLIVMIIEFLITEGKYQIFRKNLFQKGFRSEKYYEARFYVKSNQNREKLIEDLSKKFSLNQHKTLHYEDTYFENKLPEFSSREPKLRIRNKSGKIKEDNLDSVQVSYTRSNESQLEKVDQYRYFLVRKEKLYFPLKSEAPKKIENLKEIEVKRFMERFVINKEPIKVVKCVRDVIEDDKIWVAFDYVHGKNDYFIVEVKTFSKSKEYFQILRYIMGEYSVTHTTYGKSDFFE